MAVFQDNIVACLKRCIVFEIALVTMIAFSSASLAGETRGPNVVVFLVDDLGPDELVCYASRFHETPNIDALAARGMRFTHAYSGATLCSPSRAALLTGRSPARLRLTDWIPGQRQLNRKTLTPDWQPWIDRERVCLECRLNRDDGSSKRDEFLAQRQVIHLHRVQYGLVP